jgi:saccharopine dehydrogenase-like NADP-dependent oxidoreductase
MSEGPLSNARGSARPETLNIVFFGLGAVGASLLICLAELAERDGVPVRFVVYTIDPSVARDALFHAEPLLERIELVEVPDFAPVFDLGTPYDAQLANAALLVNAALPSFNCSIIELGLRLGASTLDLASEMYDAETERTLTFAQYRFDQALREQGVAALINLGISPGITNFLIGARLHQLLAADSKDLEIERVDLYLLEDIDADAVIFSWSPVVALDELSQHPLQLEQGRMVVRPPFTAARHYLFPHEPAPTRQYPLYQEELLSLHRSFPEIESIGVYTGGSEVELIKALHELNLLSKRALPNQPGLTVEAVVRAVLPGMKRPRRIEEYLRSGVIRRAHFCAAAEIRVSEAVRNERQTVIETVGLSYLRYRGLLDTPYAGATYIAYPTAVGAAILAWHTLEYARTAPGTIQGVVTGEDLARLLPRSRVDAVRRDLVAWDIDLFESVRDAAIT